jgi:glycine hydroxymethyltransferase
VTSGVRFGTNGLALRGMGPGEMPRCAELVDRVLTAVRTQGERAYELDPGVAAGVREGVAALCARFPLPGYGAELPAPPWAGGRLPVRDAASFDPSALPVEGTV